MLFNETIKYRGLLRKNEQAFMLMYFIERYVNAAIWQFSIVSEANKFSPGGLPILERVRDIFSGVHFYFICWDKVRKLLNKLIVVTQDKTLREIRKRYATGLKEYRDARDHLEHIDERLLGRSKKIKPKMVGDLGNMDGDYFTFWGYKFYVGESSVEKIKRFYLELIDWAKTQK